MEVLSNMLHHNRTLFLRTLFMSAVFLITPLQYIHAQETVTDQVVATDTVSPIITSDTFPDPNKWYNQNAGSFAWHIASGTKEVAVEIATSSSAEPLTVYHSPIDSLTVSPLDVHEGVQYLQLQFKDADGWGEIISRPLKIDRTPPAWTSFSVLTPNTADNFPELQFSATDDLSGIDHYVVYAGSQQPVVLSPQDGENTYTFHDLKDGTHTVGVFAYDAAGNATFKITRVPVTAGWLTPDERDAKRLWVVWTSTPNIIIVLLSLIVLGLFLYILTEHRRRSIREAALIHEANEIQTQMEKIFTALRDEIYDQVNAITKRPRLSKKEQEAVMGLNHALEVSETLIENEIRDVKDVLKK